MRYRRQQFSRSYLEIKLRQLHLEPMLPHRTTWSNAAGTVTALVSSWDERFPTVEFYFLEK